MAVLLGLDCGEGRKRERKARAHIFQVRASAARACTTCLKTLPRCS